MKLWLISQSECTGYDTYSDAVVAAKDANAAAKTYPSGNNESWGKWDEWASKPEHVTVKYLGTAAQGTKAGVILASYHAG